MFNNDHFQVIGNFTRGCSGFDGDWKRKLHAGVGWLRKKAQLNKRRQRRSLRTGGL